MYFKREQIRETKRKSAASRTNPAPEEELQAEAAMAGTAGRGAGVGGPSSH